MGWYYMYGGNILILFKHDFFTLIFCGTILETRDSLISPEDRTYARNSIDDRRALLGGSGLRSPIATS